MKSVYAIVVPVIIALSFSTTPTFAFAAANPAVGIGGTTNTARNWSGYVATNGTFTGVSGSWTVPSVAASASAEADATWVGIGGLSSNNLIQIGTQAITQNNAVSYEAWYELLPADSVPISISIKAGDSITASIAQVSAGSWQVAIFDNTTGQNFSTMLSYTSSLSSAEWIEEMPSDQVGYIPLDNFGSVSFTGASTIENGASVTPAQVNAFPLTMITSAGQPLATPSALGADGASFGVTRTLAAANTAPRTVRTDGRGGFQRSGNGIGNYAPRIRNTRTREEAGSKSMLRERFGQIGVVGNARIFRGAR